MSSQQFLFDITLALNSSKKKERICALENLIDLLNQERTITILNKNSKSKENITWDTLFIRVHNTVLSITDENGSKSRQISDKHHQIIQNVISEVVEKSTQEKVLILDSNIVVSSLLAVFESNTRSRCLGSTYLNLFMKHILTQKKKWCTLKKESWIGIKNLCKNQYHNPSVGIHCIMFLEILIDVIRFSSKVCQISHNYLDLFEFIKNVYISYKKSGCNFEIVLLRLTNTFCLQLAVEFRYKVCDFMESLFSFVINFHEKKKLEKNTLVHHFLMISLNIHNPNGLWDDKSTYANNVTKWKSQIKEIYFFCIEEVKIMLKNPNQMEMEIEFLDLFVYVSHLMCVCDVKNFPEISNEEISFGEPGPSNKRKCISDSNTSVSSDFNYGRAKQIKHDGSLTNLLKDIQSSDGWFWLKFLEMLIHKFPHDIRNEYCQFVEILYQIICDKKDVKNTKAAIRCLCALIEVESSMEKKLIDTQVQNLIEIWNKISVELLRFLNTETGPETHLLVRSLISHSKLRDPGPLIKLYCSGSLQSNLDNFKTLSVICQNCVLPEVLINENIFKHSQQNYDSVRTHLLLWLLRGEEKYPCKDLAKMLITLILKRFEEEIENCVTREDILISRININDFCKMITNNCMTVVFRNLKFVDNLKTSENNHAVRVDVGMKNKLFELLAIRGKSFIDVFNNESRDYENTIKTAKDCVWFCELLCHVLSHFENMSESDNSFLYEELESLLFLCTTKCCDLIENAFFDLSPFSSLYEANYHKNVQQKIRNPNFISLDFLKNIFEVFRNRREDLKNQNGDDIKSVSRFSQFIKNPQSILHFETLSKSEKIIINSVEFLCQYIAVPGSSDSNRYQSALASKIVDNLISDELLNKSSNFHLQLILRIIYIFTKYDGISVSVLNSCLDLIQLILDWKPTDPEVMIIILQLLKDLTLLVHKFGNVDSHLKHMKIIGEFKQFVVVKKNCGIKAVTKFVECLAEISKVDLEGNWAVLQEKDSSFPVFDEIIRFLKHPYHEVRLIAAQHVGLLFVFNDRLNESTIAWQKKNLNELFIVLNENSELRPKEKGCVTEYFDCVISSVSLISLAGIICLSTNWRKRALFYLIYLAFLKEFKNSDVNDIINFICNELKIGKVSQYISSCFPYLIRKWAEENLQVQDFPFYLLGCDTDIDFYDNYYPRIATAYAQTGQLDIINLISAKLQKNDEMIIKHCHSMFMGFILPNLSENVDCETAKKAQKLKRFIEKKISPEVSIRWLTGSLDEVIFYILHNMHDTEYLNSLCNFVGNFEEEKSISGFSVTQVIETLENLSNGQGKTLLGTIALEVPSVIQKILLRLLEDLNQAVIYEDKVFAFHKYVFFVEMICKVTNKGSVYYNINTFIIRDVVYSLATIVKKDVTGILTTMSCECFRKMAQSYLEEFSTIFGKFLPTITSVLLPVAKKSESKALEILNFLICENYTKLESDIVFLDPFPPDDVFQKINRQMKKAQINKKSLRETVEHFIKAGNSKNSGCRIEGLKNLRTMLSKKLELKEMYEELRMMRGFSEDCKKSLLHQLICMLIELTSDKDLMIKVEAANCLGELGPSDLTTIVLKPENNFTSSKETATAINRLIKSSVTILSDFLTFDNYEVKKISSEALYAVLSTRQGKEIVQSNKENLNIKYLTPFLSKSTCNLEVKINKDVFINKLHSSDLWMPRNHEKWIVNLTEGLLLSLSDSCDVIKAFIKLIKVNWQFAENIFSIVLDYFLSLNDENCRAIINKNVNAFFEKNFDYKNKSSTSVNKTSVQCMVNVVDYIRIQKNHEEIYEDFYFKVNYLRVAKAALYCSAFFTSIFYAELWFEEERKKDNVYMDINTICELYPVEGFALTEILRECHSKIGNADGIHGCGYMHILDPASEIQHYEHLQNWNLSLLYHDVQLSLGNTNSEIGLLNSLERSGWLHILTNLFKANKDSPEIAAIQYKCSAKLHDWSQLDTTFKTKNNFECFEKCYYFALKAFHDDDDAAFQNETQKARKGILNELKQCNLESSKNFYLPISKLQCLKELEEFSSIVRYSDEVKLENLFKKWEDQDDIKCSDFTLVESILTNRAIIIRDSLERTKDSNIKNCLQLMLCEIYYKLTNAARKEKKYETAVRTLSYLSNINHIPEQIVGKMKLEKSRMIWERGDKEIGKFLLNHFLKKNEITGKLKSKSLRIYGDWMAKTKSENSREIIEKYYLKSISQSDDNKNRINSFASLAKFADSNYEQLNNYLSSSLFEIKQNLINTQQDLASELRQELGWNQNREKKIAYHLATKQSAIDENEIKNSKSERDSYLSLALKYYLLSLKEGEKYNLVVFRVISLWLSNASKPEVIQHLQKILHHIPTYKFLSLLPQLVPRMADVCLISDLIEKILVDHPHHTLPFIFALVNSYEDLKYSGEKTTVTNPRIQTAKSMLEKYQNHQKLGKIIKEMRQFTSALIELANYNPVDKGKPGQPIYFPDYLKVKQITKLTSVSVPSLHIPYNKNCIYNDIVGIHKFQDSYYLVGGVNLPKRINCVGTDGINRTLLVKGKDDLRQDAVMQQVFTIMNSLLYQNAETNNRKLVIRTYKVVPLSQRSGVIEWCENTQPLSLYLIGADGKSGAHKKFYPNDTTAYDCRCTIRKVFAESHVTNEDKLKVFLDVCKQIHPVFHHFFIENFPEAGIWFERRLAYIHSVATSSMIGYILGIGDRHVQNILIDNVTAEVIHIDLGIAFEQGKTLPTPETVPFRLTRDIIDGMGLSGVEGDFRISCIKTMEVLRNNQDAILTLLEVLLYDPLYTWTITPEKAYLMQNHTETSSTTTDKSSLDLEINKMAERALIRLKQKLQGTEVDYVATNVEGQVNYLIQQARDPNNLCRLFHGWQAYL